jgi:hypothetical protein
MRRRATTRQRGRRCCGGCGAGLCRLLGLPRPGEAEYEGLVARLEKKLDARPMDPGRTDTFRRLNRTEYQNAIRDLLAVDVDVTNLLPADDVSRGFDNVTVGNHRRRCSSGIWERRGRSAGWRLAFHPSRRGVRR